MEIKKCLLGISIAIFLLTSCQKDELPVPKHDSGNVITASVDMNADYRYQIYFDLKTNTMVGQNLKTIWDLGFETSEQGYMVILNSSKAMYAYNTGNTNFTSVIDTSGYSAGKKFDVPTGNLDSTAIGNWQGNSDVYIIDRGFSYTGAHQGFRKIQFQSVSTTKYIVRFSQLNGTGDTTLQVNKDEDYNFSFLSLGTSSVVTVEPPKDQWDIVFTQYLEVLPTPYLVTGVMLNRNNVAAAMDSSTTFSNIDFSFGQSRTLSTNQNIIGYSWKEYSFVTSNYTVFPQMNYIIMDNEGYYFNLHFIDFYNTSGIKGNPKWEFQQL